MGMDARNIQNVKEREGANEMGFFPRERLFVIAGKGCRYGVSTEQETVLIIDTKFTPVS